MGEGVEAAGHGVVGVGMVRKVLDHVVGHKVRAMPWCLPLAMCAC